jgi:phenylacetate-CoA ligase
VSALKEILTVADRHPWYQGHNGGDRLGEWPILTKSDLYERLRSARQDASQRGGVYYSRSGGTTSKQPLFFPTDIAENHEQRARLARRLAADGVLSSATVAVNVCPIVRMYRAMEIFNEFAERCGATVLPMAAIADNQEICEVGALFAANTLLGMPSRLVALGRHVQEHGLTWSVETVLFGGEFLQPGKRRLLREVFGVRRFSGAYGSAELGVVAWHPDLPEVPVYHFPRDILHVEIVDADADGYGALVATNVVRRRFPIVRYNTGDVGRIVAETSDRVSVELRGRTSDSFLIGDNYHALADFADVLGGFAEFQVQIDFDEARRKDVIRFLLVSQGGTVTEEERQTLYERIHARLQGHELMYATEVVVVGPEALVRSSGGLKTPAIVDRRGR